jgi:hypothetical protein
MKKVKGAEHSALAEALAVWMGHLNAKNFRARMI